MNMYIEVEKRNGVNNLVMTRQVWIQQEGYIQLNMCVHRSDKVKEF